MKQWDVAGVRVELHDSRPEVKVQGDTMKATQRWLPPYVSITTLARPSLDEPKQVLAVIDALAAAGIELEKALDNYHSGVLL